MRIKKIIDKYCTPTLSKYGFTFLGARYRGVWIYQRIENEVIQEIEIKKLTWGKTISLMITTQNSPESPLLTRESFSSLIKNKIPNFGDWDYQSEDDLKDILETHMQAFEENGGMKLITNMSIPVASPTNDMQQELMQKTKQKAEEFRKEYNLTFEKDINNVEKLEKILLEKREATNVAIDKKFLISAAAYYGELIIQSYSGEWKYEKFDDNDIDYFVYKIGFRPNDINLRRNSPLHSILNYYSNPYYYKYNLVPVFKSYNPVKD